MDKELYSIQNKEFKIQLLKVMDEERKYIVKLETFNGGEFNRKFKSIIDAEYYFTEMIKDLHIKQNTNLS
jgi:hypothetical protein